MSTTYAVLPLGAWAYKKLDACLTHLVEVTSMAPQCRVKAEHILEDMSQASHEQPSCKTCAKKLAQLGLKPVEVEGDRVWRS